MILIVVTKVSKRDYNPKFYIDFGITILKISVILGLMRYASRLDHIVFVHIFITRNAP